jgi:hypothetical protein
MIAHDEHQTEKGDRDSSSQGALRTRSTARPTFSDA